MGQWIEALRNQVWEPYGRAALRVVLAFVISLHGLHKIFGVFELGGRRGNPVVALETLPQGIGYLELAGALLLLLGWYVRPVASFFVLEAAYAYLTAGLPHGILPMRNSSQESSLLGIVMLYFAFAGGGALGLDSRRSQASGSGALNVLDRWTPYVLSFVRIVVALLFFQHGLEKLFGIPNGRVGPPMPFLGQRWFSALLEFGGGLVLASGLFTRSIAFLLCGEMATAYFISWVPQGKWIPITGSEEAVVFCYAFLWLFTAGPGPLSLDVVLQRLRYKEVQQPVETTTRR